MEAGAGLTLEVLAFHFRSPVNHRSFGFGGYAFSHRGGPEAIPACDAVLKSGIARFTALSRSASPLRIPPLCADSCESAGTAGYPDLIRPSGFLGAVSRQSRRGPFVGPRSSASRSSTRLHALSRACDPFEAFVFHRYLRGFPSLLVHPVVSPRVLAVLTSGFRWLLTFNCMSFLLRGAGCFVSQVVRALNQAGV